MSGLAALSDDIAAALGLGEPLRPMVEAAGGEQARIWRLDTTTGSYAVKEPRPGFEPRTDGVDVAFLEAVREQTEVFTPMPVRREGGDFVVPVGGTLVRASTWVDLGTKDAMLDPVVVGRVVAALHQVEFPIADGDEVHPWYWEAVGEPLWLDYAQRLSVAGAPFAETLQAEIPHLVALEGLLEPPAGLRMCHCDLWSDNVLPTPSGEVCVIDWDNCGPADPNHELAVVVYEFGLWQPTRVRALYEAYSDAGGPGRIERPGQFTMLIAQFGHFWEMAVREWLDPESDDANRAHAESRVAELMTPPLRVDTITDILTALR